MFMVLNFPRSSLLMTMLSFYLLEGDVSFSVIHPFSGFRFCVINHVSALFNQCNMSNGYKRGPYNELCHMWDSLVPSVHTLLCNPVGPRKFCALPSECLALWQHQLNVSVRHTPSAVDILGANICLATVESRAPYLPVFTAFHVLHTPSSTGSGFSLVQHTSYFKVRHGPADHPPLI